MEKFINDVLLVNSKLSARLGDSSCLIHLISLLANNRLLAVFESSIVYI